MLVDCTGDANAVALAGFGLERNEELQPGTLNVRLSGYDPAGPGLRVLDRAYEDAVAAGSLRPGDRDGTATGCAPSCVSEARTL